MTAAAKMASTAQNDQDDEITIERRVRFPAETATVPSYPTTRLTKIDSRLLAIARGELDPEDPFGGLIPIYDNDEDCLGIDEGWLTFESDPEPLPSAEGMFGKTVPTVRMRPSEIMRLPIDSGSSFFLSQIDGRRTVEELVEICRMDELSGLETIDELLRLGAIDLA